MRIFLQLLGAVLTGAAAGAEPADLRQCRALADPGARLACYDALADRPAEPAAQDFGKPRSAAADGPASLQSALAGKFDGWKPGTIFRLQNGQRWKASGGDQAYYPGIPENPAVTITRSFVGAYWMEVEGVGRSIKVTRLE